MALANVGTSQGEYTYSGIKMRYTMTILSVTQSGTNASVKYNLKSYRVSGDGHPYASIQSYLNGSQKYDSGYNSYSSWPGKEGNNDYTHSTSGWGSNITFQVKGHIGSSSSNVLSGNVQTIQWNTLSYSTAQGTAPASSGEYTGNSVTVAAAPSNLPNAWRFDGWNTRQDGTGTAYSPGASITFNNANVTLYAQLTLLKPTMNIPTLGTATENSIPYGALSADINGCTYEYTVDNGANWNTASASGGNITQVKSGQALSQGTSYTVKFRATYSGNVSDVVTAGSKTTYYWPSITSLSTTTINAGSAVTINLYNPLGRTVAITPTIGNTTIGTAKNTSTTSISITLSNNDIISQFGQTETSKTIRYTSSYSGHTSYKEGTISLTSATGPTVNSSKINSFITYSVTDGKEDTTHLVRGKSSLILTLNSANNAFVASTGTTLATNQYTYSINGGSPVAISLGTPSASLSIPSDGTSYTITIACKDKRGFANSQTCSRTISTTAVTNPVISLENIKRYGSTRTQVNFTSKGTWNSDITSIGKYGQGARLILEYKANTNPNWSSSGGAYGSWEVYTSGSGNMVLNNTDVNATGLGSGFAVDQGYDFRLKIKNKYASSYIISNVISIPRSEPIMFVDGGVNGVGINCFPRGTGLWLKRGINTVELSFDTIYPIGSIYMSVNSTNPGTLFGGTWAAWGTGKVPVGINTSDTDFNQSEKTGGSKTSVAAHTHSFSGTTENQSANHTHTIANHSHTMAHTHNIGGKPITTNSTTKDLNGKWRSKQARFPGSSEYSGIITEWEVNQSTYWSSGGGKDKNTVGWYINAVHEHTGIINNGTSTDGSSAANTGEVSLTTGNQSASHNHSFSGTTGSTGTANNGNLQPYIVCYMWKRTG